MVLFRTITGKENSMETLKYVHSREEVPAGRGLLEVMTSGGDMKLSWDPRDEGQVALLERQVEGLKTRGYRTFRLDERGKATCEAKGKDLRDASRLVSIPQMSGG